MEIIEIPEADFQLTCIDPACLMKSDSEDLRQHLSLDNSMMNRRATDNGVKTNMQLGGLRLGQGAQETLAPAPIVDPESFEFVSPDSFDYKHDPPASYCTVSIPELLGQQTQEEFELTTITQPPSQPTSTHLAQATPDKGQQPTNPGKPPKRKRNNDPDFLLDPSLKCTNCNNPVPIDQDQFCAEIGQPYTICDNCLDEEAKEAQRSLQRWNKRIAEKKATRRAAANTTRPGT